MAALFGPWNQLHRFTTVDTFLDHFRVDEEVWRAFEAQVGSPGSDLRLLATLPKVAVITGCGGAFTSDGLLNFIQATQVGLVWRLARRVVAAVSGVDEANFVDACCACNCQFMCCLCIQVRTGEMSEHQSLDNTAVRAHSLFPSARG